MESRSAFLISRDGNLASETIHNGKDVATSWILVQMAVDADAYQQRGVGDFVPIRDTLLAHP